MANQYYEPNSPIEVLDKDTGNTAFVYPQTTAKQVIIDDDGARLNDRLDIMVVSQDHPGERDDLELGGLNAQYLNGNPATYYADSAKVTLLENQVNAITNLLGAQFNYTFENGVLNISTKQ